MRKTLLAAVPIAVVLAACAGPGAGGVTVKRTDVAAPPKPAGCSLEVLNKTPSRPHEALGELSSHLTRVPAAGAVSVLLPKACELGADAVVVTREMVLNEVGHVMVAVTAIRWTGEAPPPAQPSQQQPEAQPMPLPEPAPAPQAAPPGPPAGARPEQTPRY